MIQRNLDVFYLNFGNLKQPGYASYIIISPNLLGDECWEGEKEGTRNEKKISQEKTVSLTVAVTKKEDFDAIIKGVLQFCDYLCIFLKIYNSLVTSKICFL